MTGVDRPISEINGHTKDLTAYEQESNSVTLCQYQSASNYTAGELHAGCNVDMHGWTLKNPSFEGGGINGTLNFVQILRMDSDGTVASWSNGCKMQFKNGILISGTWNG